jgi:hypothetical protein
MKANNSMSFHKLLDDIYKRVSDLPQEYFDEQNRIRLEEIEKIKILEDNRKERVANMDYEKELLRTDLTHTQRMFYRKMAQSQNLKGE